MANTLTNLLPTIVKGFDVVSREAVGFIPSVMRDSSTDRVAKNQTLYSWKTGTASLSDITPGNVSPQAGDSALSNIAITITNFKMADFYLTGEETLGLGGNVNPIMADLVEQRIRAIVNQMETDIFTAASVGASRAVGTAGTTPFATTVGGTADLGKVLTDNGAALERSLIIDTTAGAKLRTLAQLTKANEAGTTMTLRDGQLLDLNRFSIKESAAVTSLAIGTGSGYLVNHGGGYAVGVTAITVDTGTGTVVAGDIITIGSDPNQYIVASALAANVVTIAAPGLRKAVADNDAITVVAAATRNIGFTKNAILLAARLPALPTQGDIATEREIVIDSRSGIPIEVSVYPQYRQVRIELAAAWSAYVLKPEHIAQLLG